MTKVTQLTLRYETSVSRMIRQYRYSYAAVSMSPVRLNQASPCQFALLLTAKLPGSEHTSEGNRFSITSFSTVTQRTRNRVKFIATLLFSVVIFAVLGIATGVTVLLVCSVCPRSTVQHLSMKCTRISRLNRAGTALLLLILSAGWGGRSTPGSGRFTPPRDRGPRTLCTGGWVWPGRPACSESLYRLSYPGPQTEQLKFLECTGGVPDMMSWPFAS